MTRVFVFTNHKGGVGVAKTTRRVCTCSGRLDLAFNCSRRGCDYLRTHFLRVPTFHQTGSFSRPSSVCKGHIFVCYLGISSGSPAIVYQVCTTNMRLLHLFC